MELMMERQDKMIHFVSDRITVNPEQCGGWPCIRGMRIRVVDILELLAAGLSFEDVIEELPDLEKADLFAVMKFAASRVDHSLLVAA